MEIQVSQKRQIRMEWCIRCTVGISNEQCAKFFHTCPECYPKIKRKTMISNIVGVILASIAGPLIIFAAGPSLIAMLSPYRPPTQLDIGLITAVFIIGGFLFAIIPVGLNLAIKFGKNLKNPDFIDKNWEKKLEKLNSSV